MRAMEGGMAEKLLIIGAGPKAAAIIAKANTLSEHNYDLPDIVVIDEFEPGANWRGSWGYTDGHQVLGTPPEKDVGFPYDASIFGLSVAEFMLAQYSWQAFLIHEMREYGEWVDRGRRHPRHHEWAWYIDWLFGKTPHQFVCAKVVGLLQDGNTWSVHYIKQDGTAESLSCDGVVITGPGPASGAGLVSESHDLILDGRSFWYQSNIQGLKDLIEDAEPVVVIGSEETAATVVVELVRQTGPKQVPILIVNRQGTIFSRGEGYHENRMFTNPEGWGELSRDSRAEVFRRTDRGVISIESREVIDGARNVHHEPYDVAEIILERDETVRGPSLDGRYPVVFSSDGKETLAQLVVIAMGFDAWWFSALLQDNLRDLFTQDADQRNIEDSINFDLSVASRYCKAPLHLPMLAAMSQGPGMPNLSCLGYVADRILSRYASHRRKGNKTFNG